jgi:voltage-gated potassium channel Kch
MGRLNWSERQRWWLLAGAWVLLLVLGVGGFVQQSRDLDLGLNFLDHVYLTLQLAALDYKGASSAINWRLQVARFAAPGIAAGTLLQSASVVFREQFTRWRSRRARGHTLVCGLGAVGTRLAEALVADGRRVIAVTPQPNVAGEVTVKRAGVPVVVGDPTDPLVLKVVRAERAARVVAVTDHDATNVAIAAAVSDLERPPGMAPLRCAVRLLDGELAHLLRSTELGRTGGVRLEFFSVHERAAQALLDEHPIDAQPIEDGHATDGAHLMVLGLGQLGRDLVVTAAQRWVERGVGALPITLIDRQAHGRLHALRMRHPALRTKLDARCIALDIGAPTEAAVDEFERVLAEHPPSLVIVAFEDEALAWTSGLFVRRRVTRPVDIVVRTDSDGGLGKHLHRALGERGAYGRIVAFPFLERACTTDLIEGGVREQLARSLHSDHVARVGSGAALHREWAQLSDAERESSRAAADAVVERLDAIGARLVPLAAWDLDREVFTPAEVEQLAAAEHARWKAEREAAGWTYGAVRDDVARHNPLLVDWDQLPDDARQHNRDAARALPALLARAGFEVAR